MGSIGFRSDESAKTKWSLEKKSDKSEGDQEGSGKKCRTYSISSNSSKTVEIIVYRTFLKSGRRDSNRMQKVVLWNSHITFLNCVTNKKEKKSKLFPRITILLFLMKPLFTM